ncbi:hypothetical protein GCM10009850_096010 [Nonomuraea monospora]|uniref:Uncharacterized protein n=1 Tax=Nonomuraea monospora TaxID=568818 RepID=A0ABN3CXB9_9ACTN
MATLQRNHIPARTISRAVPAITARMTAVTQLNGKPGTTGSPLVELPTGHTVHEADPAGFSTAVRK